MGFWLQKAAMTLPTVTEQAQTWTVEGLQLAGLVSGPADGIPVLALHGWLDNAASFSALRPFLTQARLVAIDMPGHGLSDHRSTDSGYQIWDDLPQLAGLLDQFGWERCVLLGHSRGAMISTLLAAAFPERVDALITLDGMACCSHGPWCRQDGHKGEGLVRRRTRKAAAWSGDL
jgi:pimeloyl-ACP methyl ester carboxylesterase